MGGEVCDFSVSVFPPVSTEQKGQRKCAAICCHTVLAPKDEDSLMGKNVLRVLLEWF